MWGNLLGWIISIFMLFGSTAMFYRLSQPPTESSSANMMPEAFKPIALPIDIDKIIPHGSGNADAGPLYSQAIIEYKSKPKPYIDAVHAAAGDLPALQLLRQAADCRRMTLFETHPQQVINYNNNQPELDALLKIADAADSVGLGALLDGKSDEASRYFTAVFSLGRQLFHERITWRELSAGMGMMSDSAQNLAKLADHANDGARSNILRRLQDEIDKYRAMLQENVASPLTNPIESYASKYAGDIFAIARETNVERVWRVQAILHLGRYRWNVSDDRRGDQVWAHRELHALENSIESPNGDPVIRTAIHAAQDLTLEQQRKATATG